jgi:hypothetical protein
MPPNDMNQRLEAVGKMLKMFKAERMVYLGINILSLLVLLSCAIYLLFQDANIVAVVGLFGSSGGITIATGRVIKMWSDAMRVLAPDGKGDGT